VHATNCPELVSALVECLGASPDQEVDCPDGSRRTLSDAFLSVCDVARPSDEAVEVLASRAQNAEEADLLQAIAEGYPGSGPEDADLLDLLEAFPSARPPLQELVSALGSAAAAALFDRLVAQGGARRGPPDGRGGALQAPRPAAQGRRLDLPGRARQQRHRSAGVRPAVARLPAARERRRADHHDRPGHRHRAVPRLPAGAPCGRRHGAQLAVLRRPARRHRLPLSRRDGRS